MMEIEGTRHRGHLKKTRWDCIRGDMQSFGLSSEDAQGKDQWRLRIRGKHGCTWKMAVKTCVRVISTF